MDFEAETANKPQEEQIFKRYAQYLKLEKGFSPNTVDAYKTDLAKLLHFLKGEGKSVLEVTLDDLQQFSAGLHDIGIHPRSQARILSGIKSFYRFLVLADYLGMDSQSIDLHPASLKAALDDYERSLISRALEEYGGVRKAAHALGVDPSTISRKAKKYGLEVGEPG